MSLDILSKINGIKCDCGKEHLFSADITVGDGVITELPEKIKKLGGKKAFLIADATTYNVAGEKALLILEKSGICVSKYVFEKGTSKMPLEPNETNVGLAIMNFDKSCDTIVAIGSGVINDIGKIIANIAGLPYIIVATAPSMDGYASATSSMTRNGLKISLDSKCPDIIIGDTDVLSTAPTKMLRAGLGDMLAKYISICEWRLSAYINGEYYCEKIAELIREALKRCVDCGDALIEHDKEAIKTVFEGLIISGAAMKLAGVSRPASGIEHYISHIWDMRGAQFETRVDPHGIQCGVATYVSARLYEMLCDYTPNRDAAIAYVKSFDYKSWAEELREIVGLGAESMVALEKSEKKYSYEKHRVRILKISENWADIIKIIREELPPAEEIYQLLERLGMPRAINGIGQNEKLFVKVFSATRDIRDKYVLSRLTFDLGITDEIIAAFIAECEEKRRIARLNKKK